MKTPLDVISDWIESHKNEMLCDKCYRVVTCLDIYSKVFSKIGDDRYMRNKYFHMDLQTAIVAEFDDTNFKVSRILKS